MESKIGESMTVKEKQTIDYYDRNAKEWVTEYGGNEGESFWKKEMERFKELLPSGKVLEIDLSGGKEVSIF